MKTKTIKKTANGTTVTLDIAKKADYLGEYIALSKDGKIVVSGYEYISGDRWINPYNPPKGTVALIKCLGDKIQPVGQQTADLIQSALDELNDLDEIRLPRERNELVMAIGMANDEYDYKREQDYNEDIGFNQSAACETKVDAAYQALKDFDLAHPEMAAKIAAEKAEETKRQIQSALNA